MASLSLVRAARASIRFPLALAVLYFWQDESGVKRFGEGRSRDISELGLYVIAEACPPVGTRVQLGVAIEDLKSETRITITGHVIRVEKDPSVQFSGFAVRTEEAVFSSDQGFLM